jgi:8-oxo-dGTP diphosphatase
MASEKLFHVGVKALIVNSNDQVLVMKVNTASFKDSTPHWDIPGGRIQQGQSAIAALKREVLEETGIDQILTTEFLTGVISKIEIPVSDNEKVGLVLVVYKVTIPENSTVTLSNEHTAYEWVTRSVAADRLRYKYPEEFIKAL